MKKLLTAFGILAIVVVALVVGMGVVTSNRLTARMTPVGLWPADDDIYQAIRLTSFGLSKPLLAFDRSHDEAAYDPVRRMLLIAREVDNTPPVVNLHKPVGSSTLSTITYYRHRERVYTTIDPAYRVTKIAFESGKFRITIVLRQARFEEASGFTAELTADELVDFIHGKRHRPGQTITGIQQSDIDYLRSKQINGH